jgi:hypothetical protein
VLASALAALAVAAIVPPGWHVVRHPVENPACDPVQRLALATYRLPPVGTPIASVPRGQALVIVLDDHTNPRQGYPAKPRRILVPWRRLHRFEGCCGLPTAPGWELAFRSGGRDLLVFVHAGRGLSRTRRAEILRVLASVRG